MLVLLDWWGLSMCVPSGRPALAPSLQSGVLGTGTCGSFQQQGPNSDGVMTSLGSNGGIWPAVWLGKPCNGKPMKSMTPPSSHS